jgi:putative ABC transport system substrate-binding protein
MKKIKSLLCVFLCAVALCVLGGCKNNKTVVTIIQYVSANALNDACEGIKEGLKEAGFVDGENIKLNVYNPQAKADTLSQYAEKALEESDIIFAIATPVALELVEQSKKLGSDVPIVFTAVTDPVASGILTDAKNPGGNVTGTTDLNPVADQIALAKEVKADATKVGFIYTAGESNSVIQLDLAKEAAKNKGLTIVDRAATNSSDIEQVVTNLLASGIDFLYIPTDNEIASNMKLVSRLCSEAGVPTICGEEGMLEDGGIITVGSVNYVELGKMTAEMGAKILNGTKAGDLAVQAWSSDELAVNKTAVQQYNLPISEEIINKADKTL